MAFFKFRKSGDESAVAAAQSETVDAMRKRARHRLIGAVVLVVVAVIGFPLIFDKQPRPIALDIPIDIPDKNKVKPLAIPPARAAVDGGAPVAGASLAVGSELRLNAEGATTTVAAPVTPKSTTETTASPATPATSSTRVVASAPVQPIITESAPDKSRAKLAEAVAKAPAALSSEKVVVKPEPRPVEPKPESKLPPVALADAMPEAKRDEAARAQALLEGKSVPEAKAVESASAPTVERFIVQVGAFADAAKARETRLKLEQAGLKTYAQVVETKEGRRTRVRVGPYASKAQAETAAQKIRSLDLSASVLSL